MQGKLNPVLTSTSFEMIYLGQENDFVKSSYSLTLFGAYFRHSLGALSPCNAFFDFFCGIFASQIFYKLTCCLGKTSSNCPKFNKNMSLFIHTVCMLRQLC